MRMQNYVLEDSEEVSFSTRTKIKERIFIEKEKPTHEANVTTPVFTLNKNFRGAALLLTK